MPLTSDAKRLLAETIRGSAQDPDKGVRALLLRAIHDEADRRYRLSVPIGEAGLDEAHRRRRARIEAWVDERARAAAKDKAALRQAKARLIAAAEKEAAATLLNRLILVRHLEALGLSKPAVLTGGWSSRGYREFREFAPALCANAAADATEGYATLLQLLFDELAVELPGLFGDVGLTRLLPIPAATLREVVERLDDPGLATAWTDDTTLGWVYQYWNDPDREALDAKINAGGKIEPHEIASKTQMFTERYMVEWLLQNSLGLTWLAMCKKRGWTPDAERVLPRLDAERAAWRERREAGEVAMDALMPIEGELEERWKYYVPQPIPDDAVERAPASVQGLRLLDPACGSGHFLVIAFDLLAALYREEARHLGRPLSDQAIAESILEHNLHGVDLDPRAIQIAAAGLYLKAKALSRSARPRRVNLVAPALQLGALPADDPALVALKGELRREAGIPEALTTKLLSALAGVDHLGSLLKVDAAVDDALKAVEGELEERHGQGDLFGGFAPQQARLTLGAAKASVTDKLEQFLAARSGSEDLGLRLDGEQLAAGVRFVRLMKEGTYDLVVGNPPYQGLTKTARFDYVAKTYPKAKADLYAAFLERGLELVRDGGISALLTMRGWMFLGQFAELRKSLLKTADLRLLGDADRGAFEDVAGEVLATVMSVFRKSAPADHTIALQLTPPDDRSRYSDRTARKRAAVLAQVGRHEFDPRGFEVIEGEPIVYWWSEAFLAKYAAAPKLKDIANVHLGISTADNTRFLRRPWEVEPPYITKLDEGHFRADYENWAPLIKGAAGNTWFEPLSQIVQWTSDGLELWTYPAAAIRSPELFFRRGVAFTPIGSEFGARIHRYQSIIDATGRSVFGANLEGFLLAMNTSIARRVMESFNPSVSFTAGDVERLPLFIMDNTTKIVATIQRAFAVYEAHREPSVEFRRPGPSAWTYAQAWAQLAVDRPEGAPLPPYEPSYEPPAPEAFVSFAVGVALGRFGAEGEGVLDTAPAAALPHGILFVSAEGADSLEHAAAAPIVEAWREHGAAVGGEGELGTYLRRAFFEFHKRLYENRPIYFPLSSSKKSFVALVSIHRWADDTLSVLLADHLVPTKRRLDGELDDLRAAKATASNKARAERRFAEVQRLAAELEDFIRAVTEVAEQGPPPPDAKTTRREADARYRMNLDDGVMVNSAALWPLVEAQWKEPKKWWAELARAEGKKDYDWAHLAARYFPARVRAKCVTDPSLAVAHKCFWDLHPARAYAWELRLQDEIREGFTIDEPGSDAARARFLNEHAREARELFAKELKRREKKSAKEDASEDVSAPGPLFRGAGAGAGAEAPEEAAEEEADA
jgi:hypothetical protein